MKDEQDVTGLVRSTGSYSIVVMTKMISVLSNEIIVMPHEQITAYLCVYIYTHTSVHVYIYICIYITYTYAYRYTYIHMFLYVYRAKCKPQTRACPKTADAQPSPLPPPEGKVMWRPGRPKRPRGQATPAESVPVAVTRPKLLATKQQQGVSHIPKGPLSTSGRTVLPRPF